MLVKKLWPLLIYQRKTAVMEAKAICLVSILFELGYPAIAPGDCFALWVQNHQERNLLSN